MIKLEIDDVGKLSPREATALSHMFMHLAGHSLQEAPRPDVVVTMPIVESIDAPTMESTDVPVPLPQPPILNSEDEIDFNPAALDSTGIPWDSRIHARNKSQTPSGVWKLGRNIQPEYVKQVLAELRNKYGTTVSIPQPMPISPPMPMLHILQPIELPTPTLNAAELYENLLTKVTTGMGNGSLTIATVNNILRSFQDFNVTNLAVLGTFSDEDKAILIPRIIAELDKASK